MVTLKLLKCSAAVDSEMQFGREAILDKLAQQLAYDIVHERIGDVSTHTSPSIPNTKVVTLEGAFISQNDVVTILQMKAELDHRRQLDENK